MKPQKMMSLKHDQVFDAFSSIGFDVAGSGDFTTAFKKGTRSDRVLIVAHADTVWEDRKISVLKSKGCLYSGFMHTGIGADDRAGCAIAYKMASLGHSVLIVSGEEKGCLGSGDITEDKAWLKTLEGHAFAVQFDRRDSNDLVYYQVGTPEFKKYVGGHMKKYNEEPGSFTDIGTLCPSIGVCGVNISVGYYNEHSPDEILDLNEWYGTLVAATEWLKKPQTTFPYVQPPQIQYTTSRYSGYSGYSGHRGYAGWDWENDFERDYGFGPQRQSQIQKPYEGIKAKKKEIITLTPEEIDEILAESDMEHEKALSIQMENDVLSCPRCGWDNSLDELEENGWLCYRCLHEVN